MSANRFPDASARPATRAVVLAAGRGTRMRGEREGGARLDDGQRRLAEQGVKALLPFHGQPYLSYVLSALADGGVTDVCVVVRAGEDPIRRYYEALQPRRLRLSFAAQEEPLGSAHALLAAEDAVGHEPFVLVNGDNVYPASVIERVRTLPGSGLAGFAQDALTDGGIPADRIAAFALILVDAAGCLERIVEKPGAELLRAAGPSALVSMTCWRLDASIFEFCRAVAPSARGEYEIPDAVMLALGRGMRFRVEPVRAAVLDLTSREDVAAVADRLRAKRVSV